MPATLDKLETREPLMITNRGQQIFAVLHRPIGIDSAPVVVVHHGFASSKHGSNRSYVNLAEHLAKSGVATIRFDFRGSGDSEGSLTDLSFEDLVSDSIAVLESVQSIEGIDSQRMGLFGASLGGAIAVYAAARFEQKNAQINALALWAPVASGELWYRDFLMRHPEYAHINPSQVLSSYQGIQLNEAFREEFKQMHAHRLAGQLTDIPILVMQGEKDETVSINHLEAFRQSCTSSDSPVRFVRYPAGEHSLGFSSDFASAIEETKQWFEDYL